MSVHIVLLNGPKQSGKTTLGKAVALHLGGKAIGFADEMKRATHAAYGMYNIDYDYFETTKDCTNDAFLGLTPRQAYIHFSETYMKKVHGNDVFARLMKKRINSLCNQNYKFMPEDELFVMTDCGFVEEAEYLADTFGHKNVLLIRLYRKGKTFIGDSRNYIYPRGIEQIVFNNDYSFNESTEKLISLIKNFFIHVKASAAL